MPASLQQALGPSWAGYPRSRKDAFRGVREVRVALGPLPDVSNTIRIKVNGSNQTTPWVALFYWHYLGGAPTGANLASFCTAFVAAMQSSLSPSFATTVTVNNAEAWDLATRTGAFGSGGSSWTGNRAGTPLPTSVAACVGWKVTARWRGGHPRTYFPAGVQTDVLNGHLWVEASRATFEAGNEGFLSQVNALNLGAAGGYLQCVRYLQTIHEADGTKHVEYINPPQQLQIQRALVDARLDTQRRRLGPDL